MKRIQLQYGIMRVYVCVIACAFCSSVAFAQSTERYSDFVERVASLPAYEQMYQLLAYQRSHPEQAAVYYRLGEVAYSMLPDKDPLHNYEERAELLYKARLFYGNGLHFMGGRLPRGESFANITPAGKKIEFEDVDAYIRARLDTVKLWRTETDTIHNRFYRMVDRYETCRQLFLQFMEKYPSEKLAHLCLTKDDYDNLENLGKLTKQFEQDKRLFTEALAASPIKHYNPQFRSVEIAVYRLDGVTSTDFLANDVPLWDYASWSQAFLEVQRKNYESMMRNIVQEYTMIDSNVDRFRQRQTVQLKPDYLLPNLIERYDYQSPIATFIRLEHLVAGTLEQAVDSLTTEVKLDDGDLSLRISAAIEARQRNDEAIMILNTMQEQINEATESKYAFFLRRTQLLTLDRLTDKAKQMVDFHLQLTQLIDQQLRNYADAYPKQYEEVDISDDQAASEAAEAAGK